MSVIMVITKESQQLSQIKQLCLWWIFLLFLKTILKSICCLLDYVKLDKKIDFSSEKETIIIISTHLNLAFLLMYMKNAANQQIIKLKKKHIINHFKPRLCMWKLNKKKV